MLCLPRVKLHSKKSCLKGGLSYYVVMWEYMETALWRQGDNGVSLYHVFGAVAFGLTVLAFGEARYGRGADCGEPHDIVMRRSEDGGRSFEPSVTLVSSLGRRCLSNPVPIHDSQTGKTFLFYNDNEYNRRTDCYIIESVDGGKTWSSPVDITADLCKYSEPLEFHVHAPDSVKSLKKAVRIEKHIRCRGGHRGG